MQVLAIEKGDSVIVDPADRLIQENVADRVPCLLGSNARLFRDDAEGCDTFVILDGGSPTGSTSTFEEVHGQHGILNEYLGD